MELITQLTDIVTVMGSVTSFEYIKLVGDKDGAKYALAANGSIDKGDRYANSTGGSGPKLATCTCYAVLKEPIVGITDTVGLRQYDHLIGMAKFHANSTVKLLYETRNGMLITNEVHFDDGDDGESWYGFLPKSLTDAYVPDGRVQMLRKNAQFDVFAYPDEGNAKAFVAGIKDARNSGQNKFYAYTTPRGRLNVVFDSYIFTNTTPKYELAREVKHVKLAPFLYPTKEVSQVLSFAKTGNLMMSFSNNGIMKIDVLTEVAKYTFIFFGGTGYIEGHSLWHEWPQLHGTKIAREIEEDKCMDTNWEPSLD